MMHHWMTVVFAANWGFAALMLALGYGLGWLMRGRVEDKANRQLRQDYESLCDQTRVRREADYKAAVASAQRTDSPSLRETEIAPVTPQPVFQTQSGKVIESPRTWDQRLARFGGPEQIPYEELEGMFLDQFLLRYFYSLMPLAGSTFWSGMHQSPAPLPWTEFIASCPWAKEMPLLFEQMTGYKLNELQLNNAIAEWAQRLSKPSEVAK